MSNRAQRVTTKVVRSTAGFVADRIASSDRMVNIVYDLINGSHFAGLEAQEEMLADRVRVEAYRQAIHRNVQAGDVVLDLGTGTGLLAFMASRAGAKKVYAVEHSDFIDVAREIGDHNGFTNIEYVRENSREFVPPEPIDVVIHEQMGDELFNENMMENLLDLRDRVLTSSARILPSRFRLFIEPVTIREDMRVRRFWNIDLPDDIDLSFTKSSPVAARFDAGRSEQYWVRPYSVASTLGDPEPIIDFDLRTLESLESLPTRHTVERTATEDTIVDGCCVWFEAVFDDETVLSTSPLSPLTSWGNRLFRLDQEVARGETLRVDVRLGQLVESSTWDVRAV